MCAAPERPLPNWERLGFSFVETDTIYRSVGELDRNGGTSRWDAGSYLDYGPIDLPPTAAFLSYGVGIFEGLKAQRTADGRILMFRPADNARRFQRSAQRMLMPEFPEGQFVEAVHEIVRRNLRFVPPHGMGTFYVRPMQHGIEAKLGIRPLNRFWVLIYGCPVGSYFGVEKPGLRLKVLRQGRCAAGGTGAVKAIGNYAGGIAVAYPWQQKGFDDVLYLDARHVRYVTETSGSNVFVGLKNGKLVTPALDDQILPGITRESTIRLAREVLGVEVEERPVSIDEVLADANEVFCTGTAWTIQSIGEIDVDGTLHQLPGRELRQSLITELRGIQLGEKEDRFGWVSEVSHGA